MISVTCHCDTALASTPVKHQSLTLNINTCDGVENKAESNTSISTFVFASVLRSDPKAKPVMRRVVACNEQEARRLLSAQYVLSLSSRLPVTRGSHATN